PGQEVWFAGRKLRVVATLSQTGIGYMDRVAFMPIEGARRLLNELKNSYSGKVNKRPTANRQSAMDFGHLISGSATDSPLPKDLSPDGVSMVFIKVSDGTLSKALASSIASKVDGIAVILLNKNAAMVKSAISQAMRPLLIPTVALVLMATMVVGVVFSMMVRERTRELGLLRAMGARRRDVFMAVALESLLVSIAGSFTGVVAGGSLLLVFKNNVMDALEVASLWPGPAEVIAVSMGAMLVSIIVGVSGALYPAYRACLMEPSKALGDCT
ncbi:MAG: ABC transporter permease, partial [Nitrospirae bacterium]|nr:ABC transporter permease [Nitrospirota bacterium]